MHITTKRRILEVSPFSQLPTLSVTAQHMEGKPQFNFLLSQCQMTDIQPINCTSTDSAYLVRFTHPGLADVLAAINWEP